MMPDRIFSKYIFSIIYSFLFLMSLFTQWYDILVLIFFASILISLLNKIGKGIALRESIAFFYVFTCLLMPLLGYKVYNKENQLARLFNRYMQVGEIEYFQYALPAILLFTLILTWPIMRNGFDDQGDYLGDAIRKIKKYEASNLNVGFAIIIAGSVEIAFNRFIPPGVRFFFDIFFFSAFAGMLMVLFGDPPIRKWLIVSAFILLVFFRALDSGMFTVLVYMSVTLLSFLLFGSNTGLLRKTFVFILGCFLLLILQNTKAAYRNYLKKNPNEENRTEVFMDLVSDQFKTRDKFFQINEFYEVFIRINQGYNVSRVMRWIPKFKPHDDGKRVFTTVLASVVPRFLWIDKPKAGGQYNCEYYAGWIIRGWSTNIGPLGEGYGAFGRNGGIVFMGFLAMFIRFAYMRVWNLSRRMPLIIFWLPVLFYQTTYSAETDTLQILNSIIKTAFFLWLLAKVRPKWFGIMS